MNRRRHCWLLAVLVGLVLVEGCGTNAATTLPTPTIIPPFTPTPAATPTAPPSQVIYRVTATTQLKAGIKIFDATGKRTALERQDLPWEMTFVAAPQQILFLEASKSQSNGDITCTILIDGHPIATDSSSGPQ